MERRWPVERGLIAPRLADRLAVQDSSSWIASEKGRENFTGGGLFGCFLTYFDGSWRGNRKIAITTKEGQGQPELHYAKHLNFFGKNERID